MRISICWKLILATLIPLLAVYVGVLTVNYQSGRNEALNRVRQELTEMVSTHAQRLALVFQSAEGAVTSQSTSLFQDHRTLTEDDAMAPLEEAVQGLVAIRCGVMVLDADAMADGNPLALYVIRPKPTGAMMGGAGQQPGRARSFGPPGAAGPSSGFGPPTRGPGAGGSQGRPGGQEMLELVEMEEEDPHFRQEVWYTRSRQETTPYWVEPRLYAGGISVPVVRFVAPVRTDRKPRGLVAMDVPFSPQVRHVNSMPTDYGYCMLITRGGQILAHPDENVVDQTLDQLAKKYNIPELRKLVGGAKSPGMIQFQDFHTGQKSWLVYSPIESVGWTVGAVFAEKDIIGPVAAQLKQAAMVMLAGLVVIVLIIFVVSMRITKPIRQLVPVVREMANGKLDVQAPETNSRDEIGEFARGFNTMTEQLQQHIDALTTEVVARESVESELRVAREIQTSLLPQSFPPFPDRDEFDLHAICQPAKQMSGDFYDFFFVGDDCVAILIADVSGKGTPAALFMAISRTVLRNHAIGGASPSEVLTKTNDTIVVDNARGMFVTIFLIHYYPKTGRVVFANAGHNYPLVMKPDGSIRELKEPGGMFLGLVEDTDFPQGETVLEPGDSLVFFTDGVTEAWDEARVQFGNDRLQSLAASLATETPATLDTDIVQAVNDFRCHAEQDDVTVMTLRRNY